MSLMTDYNPHFVKEVYCEDCKYWKKIDKHKFFCREREHNLLNNCKHYKRKWWKAFGKEE